MVFTIDHQVNPLALWNAEAIYNLLFQKASGTLKAFGKKYLGGDVGFFAVLHTWGQDLGLHIHLHCIIVGGALSGSTWKSCGSDFLFPIVELSAFFRDSFCEGLEKLHDKGGLTFGGSCQDLQDPVEFERMVSSMRGKKWEVYVKEPFGGAQKVLEYMSRYVNRVAISNSRLVSIEEERVRFRYRDNRAGGVLKEMSLDALELISRYLQHVLPSGFVRIRYYGFLHPSQRDGKLKRIREILGVTEKTAVDIHGVLFYGQEDPGQCPVCKAGRMAPRLELKPVRPGREPSIEELSALLDAA